MATVPNAYAVGYDFAVGSEVFHVSASSGVNHAVVSSISISVVQAGTTVNYSIAFKNPQLGSLVTLSTSLYGDIDSALAAYEPLVLAY